MGEQRYLRIGLWSVALAMVTSLTLACSAFASKCPHPQGARIVSEYSNAVASGTTTTATGGFEEVGPNDFSFTGTTQTQGTYKGIPETLSGTIVSGTLNCGKEEFVEVASGFVGSEPVTVTTTGHNDYDATELLNGVFTNNFGESGTYRGRILPEPPEITALAPIEGSGGGGTQVTLEGKNLKDATVRFGETVATDKVNAAGTTITVVAPPDTPDDEGTPEEEVPVTVETPGGKSEPRKFRYLPPVITGVSPKTGTALGGTTVTIKGSNLSDPTAVRFDLSLATIVKVNAGGTAITVKTPPEPLEPGGAFVTVETPGGSNLSFGLFTYLVPEITSVSPGTGPTSGGTMVTIKGMRFKEVFVDGVYFGETRAESFTVNKAGTLITAYSPPGAVGPAHIRVFSATFGISQLVQADQFTYR